MFMDSHEKFKMKELHSRSCFYNDIIKQDISDEDYEFAQILWKWNQCVKCMTFI